jgi:O-antigen biosynthesis protein WbqV
MGEPMNIMDLARRLIRLSGRIPNVDVKIEIVGPRPGEKVIEDLIDPLEEPLPSAHPGIAVSRPPVPDRPALRKALWELEELVAKGDAQALADRMKELVTEGHELLQTGVE